MDTYQYLRKLIITGQLAPNERLTEIKLAEQLQVSRTPIREALQQLGFEGLVTPLSKGYAVSSFTKNDIREIYNLRALLEGYATFEAALNRTEQDLDTMQTSNMYFIQHIHAYIAKPVASILEDIVLYNNQFHTAINSAAKNQYLKKHIEQVIILPLVYRSFYWYDSSEMKRSILAHETIFNAIQAKQPERAKVAVQEHIYQALDHVLKHIH